MLARSAIRQRAPAVLPGGAEALYTSGRKIMAFGTSKFAGKTLEQIAELIFNRNSQAGINFWFRGFNVIREQLDYNVVMDSLRASIIVGHKGKQEVFNHLYRPDDVFALIQGHGVTIFQALERFGFDRVMRDLKSDPRAAPPIRSDLDDYVRSAKTRIHNRLQQPDVPKEFMKAFGDVTGTAVAETKEKKP